MKLDFEQRARAVKLEDDVGDDPYETAAEIIGMRDIIATLVDMSSAVNHPETGKTIGFHMLFVRDADMPLLREIAAKGVVRRVSSAEC